MLVRQDAKAAFAGKLVKVSFEILTPSSTT
jgi:hypothetical protein